MRMSATGRFLPVVIACYFSSLATCYPEHNGRVRPVAVLRNYEFSGMIRFARQGGNVTCYRLASRIVRRGAIYGSGVVAKP